MDADEVLSRIGVLDNPWRWDLLPLLERLNAEGIPVRIHQRPHLTHGATEVVSVTPSGAGASILQQFFGLADPSSPLPEPYVERAVLEAREDASGPWRELLDVLSERFAIEDWRAWRARYGGIADASGLPRLAEKLLDATAGQALRSAIVSSGFLAHGVWSQAVLQVTCSILTGATCHVSEFEPEWIALPASDSDAAWTPDMVLGNAVIGDRVLAIDGSARVTLDADNWGAFESFLANPRACTLGELLVLAGEGKVSYTVVLRSRTSPMASLLGSENHPGSALGVDTWLQSQDDFPEDYIAELSLPQTSKWRGT